MPRPVIPVVAGLLVGCLFVIANVWALHDPQPHDVPVAVQNSAGAAAARKLGPGFRIVEDGTAREAVEARKAYFGFTKDGVLLYAGANGSVVNNPELVEGGVDVVSLVKGDPNGTSLQYIVLGTILGGFLTGVLMAQLALGAPLAQRAAAYAAFALAFGLVGAIVVSGFVLLPPGSFVDTWVWMTVTALTISVGVGAFARSLGQAGIPLAMLVFLIVGNPSSGASAPAAYLPGPFRIVGPYLPPNAFASGLEGTTYFDANVTRPVLVILGWLVLSALVLGMLDHRQGSRRALAYDAAGAADEREDRSSA